MKSTRGHCWKVPGNKANCLGTSGVQCFCPAQHTAFGSISQRSPAHQLHAPAGFALLGSAVRAPALHKSWQFTCFGLTETAQLLSCSDQNPKKTWYNLGKLNKLVEFASCRVQWSFTCSHGISPYTQIRQAVFRKFNLEGPVEAQISSFTWLLGEYPTPEQWRCKKGTTVLERC